MWLHNKYAVWPQGNTRAGQWDERTRHVLLQDELELEEQRKATATVVSTGYKSQSFFLFFLLVVKLLYVFSHRVQYLNKTTTATLHAIAHFFIC